MYPPHSEQSGSGHGGQARKRIATPQDNALIARNIALLSQSSISGLHSVPRERNVRYSPSVSSDELEGSESSSEDQAGPGTAGAATTTETSTRFGKDNRVVDATHEEEKPVLDQDEIPVESSGGGGDAGRGRDSSHDGLLARLRCGRGLVSSPVDDDLDNSASEESHFLTLESLRHRPTAPNSIYEEEQEVEEEDESEQEGKDYGDSEPEPELPWDNLEGYRIREKEATHGVFDE